MVSVEFGASTGKLEAGVQRVNDSLDSIQSHLSSLTDGFRSLAEIAGIALSFEGLKAAFNDLSTYADSIQNAQAKIGGSLESLTTLAGVATLAGVSFDALTEEVERAGLQVQRSTKDAYGPAAQGLKALGLSAQQLAGLPTDQWFEKVSDAVSKFNPSITLTNNVQQAFGAGFTKLMPLLMQGSDNFRELQQAVQQAQQGLASTLPGISETEQKLQLLGLRSKAFAAQIFTALKPAIDAAIDGFGRLTASISVEDIRDAANKVANVLIDIGASIATFLVNVGLQVDILKGKLNSIGSLKLNLIDKDDFGGVREALRWMERLGGRYDEVNSVLNKGFELKIGGGGQDAVADVTSQLKAIQDAALRAHDAVNGAIPVSGTWQAITQDMTRLNGETLTAAENFTKLNAAAADNGIKNRLSAQATEIEAEIEAEKAKLERVKSIFSQEAAAFKITEGQKALFTETAIEQAYQAELGFVNRKIALYAAGSREYENAEKEKAKLTEQYEKDMLATVQASQKEMTQTITQGLQIVTGAFNSQLRGLLAGTTSWAAAMKNITGDMFIKLIELGEQWAIKHGAALIEDSMLQKTEAASQVVTQAAAEAAKTQAVVTGAAARAAAETTGSAAGIGTQIAAAITSIGIDAGKVFAGVFGFLAPVMGPAAAGPAAASSAEALAAGMAPLAVGAWEIPSVMPALLHPGEMVVPANFASGIRSAASGGGQGGQSSGPQIFAPNFSGFIGTQAMIQQIIPQLARSLQRYQSLNPSTA